MIGMQQQDTPANLLGIVQVTAFLVSNGGLNRPSYGEAVRI